MTTLREIITARSGVATGPRDRHGQQRPKGDRVPAIAGAIWAKDPRTGEPIFTLDTDALDGLAKLG